ncbi:RNA-binding domain-containing protein [Methanonatronarchaeum sp. AMET-Sl]|uniref:RNA-binding domain-containing protein n=1 Tax=Methanonatronarchaeum sp. AMET-Sl TaxID=3037654 RepID=UPI00244DF45A|nr:RNA-binding domain-containing protein [Methanonatronarchaeum sp. AMET-Sl]WGI17809.1 RNA-binding domain-containing protein [Methanonatronarchaeum sp. AMET-Sl]
MTEIKLKTPIYPTEDQEKIKNLIKNLFPEIEIQIKKINQKKSLTANGNKQSLKKIREKIWEQKIIDTTRTVLHKNKEKNKTSFSINKQSATNQKINLKDNDILGTINIEIKEKTPKKLQETINWLTPETEDGKPIT